MEGNNNPLKVFKLKTCRKCGSKDVRYYDRPWGDKDARVPMTLFYVGCASCGHFHSKTVITDESYKDIEKKFLIAKWNADRNYKDKRNKKVNIKKERKNATVTD